MLPQYPWAEQQVPNLDPAQVTPLPQVPSVLTFSGPEVDAAGDVAELVLLGGAAGAAVAVPSTQ